VFGKDIAKIISDAQIKNAYISGWNEFLRRAYLFTNIITDESVIANDYEDIFSKQFKRYLNFRSGNESPARIDANLVCDALSMIYLGTTNNNSIIPLTLSRESGIAQNVQLVIGTIMTKNIKLVSKETKDSVFIGSKSRYILKLEINKHVLKTEITLPLLNYFEELKNGIISTNVDPQLSHGIESLKAELSELADDEDETFEMIILKNIDNKDARLELTDNRTIREV
jgi:hypothetical protein